MVNKGWDSGSEKRVDINRRSTGGLTCGLAIRRNGHIGTTSAFYGFRFQFGVLDLIRPLGATFECRTFGWYKYIVQMLILWMIPCHLIKVCSIDRRFAIQAFCFLQAFSAIMQQYSYSVWCWSFRWMAKTTMTSQLPKTPKLLPMPIPIRKTPPFAHCNHNKFSQ